MKETQSLRRSKRTHIPIEKILAYQKEETLKREQKLMAAYNSWKMEAHNAREQLKSNIAETQLAIVVDTLEDAKNDLIRQGYSIKSR